MILNLEDLEKIFTIYHGCNEDYLNSKTVVRDQISNVPTLKQNSLFFTCYDDSVYESILEDQKKEFAKMTRDKKKWLYSH